MSKTRMVKGVGWDIAALGNGRVTLFSVFSSSLLTCLLWLDKIFLTYQLHVSEDHDSNFLDNKSDQRDICYF